MNAATTHPAGFYFQVFFPNLDPDNSIRESLQKQYDVRRIFIIIFQAKFIVPNFQRAPRRSAGLRKINNTTTVDYSGRQKTVKALQGL